jgi:hypothetical protein
MARLISFAITERQFLDGSKDVTRRLGWKKVRPGDRLIVVRKAMGLKKGEKVHRLGEIVVEDVREESLGDITREEVVREGFPEMTPAEFVDFFCRFNKCTPEARVTRIEFERASS